MTTFHCPRCSKEWEQPDTVVSFFHRCVTQYTGDEPRPRGLPMNREARGRFYQALLEAVGEDEVRRR